MNILEIARTFGIPVEDAKRLRRCAKTLHGWAELTCGNGNGNASWALERDEETGKPFIYTYWWHDGHTTRRAIADRESKALRTVAEICKSHGLHFYHQRDPRGASLYFSREHPLDGTNYDRGVPL